MDKTIQPYKYFSLCERTLDYLNEISLDIIHNPETRKICREALKRIGISVAYFIDIALIPFKWTVNTLYIHPHNENVKKAARALTILHIKQSILSFIKISFIAIPAICIYIKARDTINEIFKNKISLLSIPFNKLFSGISRIFKINTGILPTVFSSLGKNITDMASSTKNYAVSLFNSVCGFRSSVIGKASTLTNGTITR